jgi:hypothetical protein
MRKAINENPLVQVALIGVLALVGGFLIITRMGGGDSAEPAAPASSSASVAPVATEAPSQPTPSSATTEPVAPPSGEFVAGPGLPANVADAYDSGETVVLLIVHRKGLDDRKLAEQVGRVSGVGNTELIVVEADDIADYSRIAEGVDVDRVPALVVIEPKARAEGPLPQASVSYGYRGPESIVQAVRDAQYKGRDDLPYYPE